MLLLVFAGLWLLLFWNNARLLPFHAGFDSKEHLNYISYIQQHRALPLPNEGWEMYQPPLYYLIAAASLSACKLSINDSTSDFSSALHSEHSSVSLNSFWFFAVCGSCFPREPRFIGLLLAAFLPMHLYLAHYVTNEIIVGCSGYSDALSLFASAEERNAARVAICLARIGAWRSNAGESDRLFCCCQS